MSFCVSQAIGLPCNQLQILDDGLYVNVDFYNSIVQYNEQVDLYTASTANVWYDFPSNHLKVARLPNIGCSQNQYQFVAWFDIDVDNRNFTPTIDVGYAIQFRAVLGGNVIHEWVQRVSEPVNIGHENQEQITTNPILIPPVGNTPFKLQYNFGVLTNTDPARNKITVNQSEMTFTRLG